MKKLIKSLVSTGILAAVFYSSAFAAEQFYTNNIDGIVTYNETVFNASYSGTTEGNQYVLLVTEATIRDDGSYSYSIDEDTILYIDQQEATSSGVSFDFIPKNSNDAVILLGGEFESGLSPKVIGIIKNGQMVGSTVSGMVNLQGRTNHSGATVKLLQSGNVVKTATTDAQGNYSFNSVQNGSYSIEVSKGGYLSHTVNYISIDENKSLETVTLLGGNTNGDGQIESTDLSNLLSDYMKKTNNATDIDGSGQVESTDLSILLSNYMKKAVSENYLGE